MRFVEVISDWVNRYFSNEEAIFLIVLILAAFIVLFTLGGVLAPILTAIVFAFLLQGLVARLESWRLPRVVAICIVEGLFLGILVSLLFGILPLVGRQFEELISATPAFFEQLRGHAQALSERYPNIFSDAHINEWMVSLSSEATAFGTTLLQATIDQVSNIFQVFLFVFLVPIAMFFFLKDQRAMMEGLGRVLPTKRGLLTTVGNEMARQIANYVRGKFLEILIVGLVTFLVFSLLDLRYAALLSLITGLSVLVPFVGAIAVTVPVAIVALLQHGLSMDFAYVLAAYAIIQALDGNVLVPVLFSETMNLHPISIIIAVLVFGGLWGVLGVFFAIPLATLVKAIYTSWPTDLAMDEPAASGK